MDETSSNNISSEQDFDIHVATSKDAAAIRSLIQELADFERMPDGPEISADQLAEDLKKGAVHSFVAYHNPSGEVAAMTLFYYAYSTWQGQYVHMEDLYVREKFRRNGLAQQIVLKLVKLTLEKGMKRLQWNVLNWNKTALEFYKKLGGVDLCESEGWIMYRLDEERMKNLM